MDSAAQAPPVVAVVVTCDPGPWLEEGLRALANQDYPNLSVLVVDAGSAVDPTPRVARLMPGAFVRRLPSNEGFAVAANEALQAVEGASHLLLCHDDVAPDPDAVRLLVEEAFRSNAGVVAPKLVDWDDSRRLLQVGMGADKSGAPAPLVDRGELDQGQHDGVRDVFVAPGGCTLVRADLFAGLGGYDPGMSFYGEDLDLSWRARVAGARVVVAPRARVRHLEAMSSGRRSPGGGVPRDQAELRALVRPLQLRHRLRAVLTCYGPWHLIRVLPQVALLALAEVVFGLVTGHTRTARDTAAAWSWNSRRLGELRVARRRLRGARRVADTEVRRLQVRGSARFSGFIRGQLAAERVRRRARGSPRPDPEVVDRPTPGARLTVAVLAGVTLVLLVGSRHLLTGRLPAVHGLAPLPGGPTALLRSFLSGWRPTGLGSAGPAPPALALLGLAGFVLGGATALLRTVLVLGMLPLGAVGACRLARPLGSRRANLAALIVYVAVPLPYNALANGRVGGLIAYGLTPWLAARLLRASGLPPFAEPDGRWPLAREVLPLAVALAVGAAFVPAVALLPLLAAGGLLLGSLLSGGFAGAARLLVLAVGATLGAVVLLVPWSLEFALPGSQLAALIGVGSPPERAHGLGALVRFQTGPLGAPPLGWALVAVAALPLVVGRGWRLGWATRLWTLAVLCWGLAWAGGRGWLGVGIPAAELVIAPAAVAVALAAALGMVAVEIDLPRYRFGWRQLAPTAALAAIVLGSLPVAATALGGRWFTPRADFAGLLSWMPAEQAGGAFRVLWIGDPDTLPLGSWRLGEGVGYATSPGGPPDARTAWPGPAPGSAQLLADAVTVARRSSTTRLGHLLASSAVRYVVVPLRAAPGPSRLPDRPPPADVVAALDAQVDLEKVPGGDDVLVWKNAAWAPGRALLGPEAVIASGRGGLAGLGAAELAGSPPVLPRQRTPTRFSGPLRQGDSVLLAESSSPRWQLRVDGQPAERADAFGWSNRFASPATGSATLRYRTPLLRHLVPVGQLVLWVLVARELIRRRRRGRV